MKLAIAFTLLSGSILLVGCKKTYSCTCTKPGQKDPAVSSWKLKEEDAQSNCNSLNAQYAEDSGSCTLSEG
jgi:hypothetical protein